MHLSFRNTFYLLITGVLVLLSFGLPSDQINRLSVEMKVEKLRNDQVIEGSATIYYRSKKGKMIVHFTSPQNMLIITNKNGAMKSYDIEKNIVMYDRNPVHSSQKSLLYHFLTGQTEYLGLKKEGLEVHDTKMKEKMLITEFVPPENKSANFKEVRLVHENHNPIFLGYFDKEGQPLHKIYYSDYKKVIDKYIPLKITEFKYLPGGDSSIIRRKFSDVKVNEQVNDTFFHFKVPEDAKVVDQ